MICGEPIPAAEATVGRVRRPSRNWLQERIRQRGEVLRGLPLSVAQAQFGSRAGTSGRLLPAVRSHPAENGEGLCSMAFGRTVPLPAGTRLDEECFVFLPPREP